MLKEADFKRLAKNRRVWNTRFTGPLTPEQVSRVHQLYVATDTFCKELELSGYRIRRQLKSSGYDVNPLLEITQEDLEVLVYLGISGFVVSRLPNHKLYSARSLEGVMKRVAKILRGA